MSKAASLLLLTLTAIALSAGLCSADGQAHKVYLSAGPGYDLETDNTELTLSAKFPTRINVSPEIGLYGDKLLVGAHYNWLGRRSRMKNFYGGPGVIYYDHRWGGSVHVGTTFTRDWIIEASYRVTGNWDGMAALQIGRGFSW